MSACSTIQGQRREQGQSIVFFALLLPLMAVFLLGILDYMVTSARVMQAIGVADLTAHAGVQQIRVQPNGAIISDSSGVSRAVDYFHYMAPGYVSLGSAWCGMRSGRPGCAVEVEVRSAGILLPGRNIKVDALAYLVYGITRGDQ
ncbi:MAG TPA: TadE family protein [Anaerolineales bacterium]|nr:TadE family protein [Anaerolineales bacterium]